MKLANVLKMTCTVFAVAFACQAYAQASGAADATATPTPSAKKTVRTANHRLALAVRHALSRTKGLDVARVVVLARSGKISLNGSMPTQDQVDKTTDVAKGVPGVISVNNQLTAGTVNP
ncbi:BON domain-containing protein [Burkholderia sp. L27(2015)]|uniref:BON domain-containing protein n=1 Tax=Burkholderia sp. L27(2015) TaxID=1641858 RepID=UPI00131E98B7|nr:BON domain-containing protein [Burkholderia sp. L27(2015)]